MAKISSYTSDSSLAGTEKLIGTDTDGTTLNYSLSDIATKLAGSGLTATSGVLSVDSNDAITAGTGIDISSGTVSVDVSDFMSNGTNDYILTATGTDAFQGEANLQFNSSNVFSVSGTQTITSTTADQFKVLYNASNYALMNVASTGSLEIETVGSGSLDSTITLNADGGMYFNADNGTTGITFADDTHTHFWIYPDGEQFRYYYGGNTADYFQIEMADNGAVVLNTVDAAGTGGTMTLDPDGKLVITPADITGDVFHLDADADTDNIVNIDAGALDIDATAAITVDGLGVSIDSAGVAANFSVATDGAGEDLTIGLTGATDSSIVISSTGTGADAINVDTTAGSIDIDSADNITVDAADEISITTTSADGHISLVSAHTAGVAFHLDADANAASEVDIDAGILDVDVTGIATITTGGLTKFEATGGVEIENGSSSGAPALTIDNDDTDKKALYIDAANIDADVLDIAANALTTQVALNVTANALTDGSGIQLQSSSSSTNARNLLDIQQSSTAATGCIPIKITDSGANKAMMIDHNTSGNAAQDAIGLHLDFDRTVASSGTNAHNDRGIDLDVSSASLGTSSLYGMDIDVVGATSGTSTAYGIDLDVDGADTNIGIQINTAGTHLKLVANADANDYATVTLADSGDLTIATVGSGSLDSDLTLDADGDIFLNADGGNVYIQDDTATHFDFDCDNTQIKIYDDTASADYLALAVAANGNSTISTNDNDGALGHLNLSPDGNILANSPVVMTKPTVTNLADDGSIPITEPFANIDANGSARTGIRFGGAGTAGQFLVVNNTGGEALTFHNTEGTALFRGINADHDTMEANFMGLFVSDGTYWNIIAGGVDSQPDVGLTAS
tara:strand:+ start:789 stop:3365 length:2577 start_codon:yes stop_codon:yes gene_type:complete